MAIGGQSADFVLDESRGVLYLANFTANRVEVMSLVDEFDSNVVERVAATQRDGHVAG